MPSGRKSKYSKELREQILTFHNQKLPYLEIKKKLNLNMRVSALKGLIYYWEKNLPSPQILNKDINISANQKPKEEIVSPVPEEQKKTNKGGRDARTDRGLSKKRCRVNFKN